MRILEQHGYSMTQAASGAEALTMLQNSPVDLLITDIKLPDTDGISLMKQAFQSDPKLTAVTMTGYGSVDVAVEAMKAGAADFLTKPFQADVVALTVKRLADLRRLRQENAVLKHELVRSGTIRFQHLALADFGNGGRIEGPDGLTDYERGLREGERRVTQAQDSTREQERIVLTSVTRTLEDLCRRVQQSAEQEVASLAFSIATKIVRQAGETTRELVLEQVRAALVHVAGSAVVQITVHPTDLPTVEAAKPHLTGERDRPVTIICASDPRIAPGGCVLHTANRLIDATLDMQLKRLGDAIQARGARERG